MESMVMKEIMPLFLVGVNPAKVIGAAEADAARQGS
jgi:hypothetical protein